ncbi:hypothetical protein AUM57_17530 [Cronobacter sakazakii]|nr:hypothetical protein [Cronobacter sakazakii]
MRVALLISFFIGTSSLRTYLRGNLIYCINMMGRTPIEKASSEFPTYRESAHRSNVILIYSKVC